MNYRLKQCDFDTVLKSQLLCYTIVTRHEYCRTELILNPQCRAPFSSPETMWHISSEWSQIFRMVRKHLGFSEWKNKIKKKKNHKNTHKFLPTTKGVLSDCPSKLHLQSNFRATTNLPMREFSEVPVWHRAL